MPSETAQTHNTLIQRAVVFMGEVKVAKGKREEGMNPQGNADCEPPKESVKTFIFRNLPPFNTFCKKILRNAEALNRS